MPAMLDDPDAATIYRVSGEPPYPGPAHPSLPPSITPRHVMLRDRQTVATVVPFASRYQVPDSLLRYLNDQFNKEIEGGDTYPMMEGLPFEKFASYWFQNFGAIMLLGNIESADDLVEGKDWSKECLGTFYIKPNYPGRSSHVCNAGFIVTDASRNRGVGRLMGESYLDWAPRLGYTYSVFNLVYETNVASCKIWDALGFKRIGRVKEAGNLKSYPGRLIDAIIYGRDLGLEGDGAGADPVSEERFDKIKFYLKFGRYPSGADRAEKSRLRSAATHYKLVDNVLMLKDKEVIAHAKRQYEIARLYHENAHAGINKTTATIAERYHWSRIKETVSDVIRNCSECKELGKTATTTISPAVSSIPPFLPGGGAGADLALVNQSHQERTSSRSGNLAPPVFASSKRKSHSPSSASGMVNPRAGAPWNMPLSGSVSLPEFTPTHYPDTGVVTPSHTLQSNVDPLATSQQQHPDSSSSSNNNNNPMLQDQPHDLLRHQQQHTSTSALAAIPTSHSHSHHSSHHVVGHEVVSVYHPIDPQIINQPSSPSSHIHHHNPLHHGLHAYSFPQHDDHTDPDEHTFAALLNEAELSHHQHHHHHHDPPPHHLGGHQNHHRHDEDGVVEHQHHHRTREEEEEAENRAAVDRDLEMLIQQPQDEDDDVDGRVEEGVDGNQRRRGGMDIDDGVTDGIGGADDESMSDVMDARRTSAGTAKMDLGHLLSSHDHGEEGRGLAGAVGGDDEDGDGYDGHERGMAALD